jgi:hypothetical protein
VAAEPIRLVDATLTALRTEASPAHLPVGIPSGASPRPAPLPIATATPAVGLPPGASVPARAPSPEVAAAAVAALAAAGWRVVVTGGPGEVDLAARVSAGVPGVVDASGRTSFAQLATLLEAAAVAAVIDDDQTVWLERLSGDGIQTRLQVLLGMEIDEDDRNPVLVLWCA